LTNDTTTLNGALTELGETMADNLVTQGVTDATASDGLTTLAGKILEITGGGGLSLTITLALSSSSNSINLGQSVTLTATLTASYDGTNVDLTGYLEGATITFKDGATTIGTDTTSSTGVATYTYTPLSAGTCSLTASFASTDGFDDATSSTVSVTVIQAITVDSITVTGSSAVIQSGGTSTLTITALDSSSQGVSGASIDIYKGSTKVDTVTTGAGGTASYVYTGTGAGDVTFYATDGTIQSQTYAIEDCYWYDPASSDRTSEYSITSYKSIGYSFTYDSNGYYVLADTNTASPSVFPTSAPFTSPIVFECDMYIQSKSSDNDGILISDSNGRYNPGTNQVQGNYYELFSYGANKGLAKTTNGSWASVDRPSGALSTGKWYHMSLTFSGTTVTGVITEGNNSVYSKTVTSTFTISNAYPIMYTHGTNNNLRWKNLKVKKVS